MATNQPSNNELTAAETAPAAAAAPDELPPLVDTSPFHSPLSSSSPGSRAISASRKIRVSRPAQQQNASSNGNTQPLETIPSVSNTSSPAPLLISPADSSPLNSAAVVAAAADSTISSPPINSPPVSRGILKLKPALKKPAITITNNNNTNPSQNQPSQPSPMNSLPPSSSSPLTPSLGIGSAIKDRLSMIAKRMVGRGSDFTLDRPDSAILPSAGSQPTISMRKSRRIGSQPPIFSLDSAAAAEFISPQQAIGMSDNHVSEQQAAASLALSGATAAISEDEKSNGSDSSSDSDSDDSKADEQINEDLLEALAEFASAGTQPGGKKKAKSPSDRRAHLLTRAFTIATKTGGIGIVPINSTGNQRNSEIPEVRRDSSLPSTDSMSDAPLSPMPSFPDSQSMIPSNSQVRGPMVRKSSHTNETRRFSTKRQFTMTTQSTQSNGTGDANNSTEVTAIGIDQFPGSSNPVMPVHRRQLSLSKSKSRRSLSKTSTLKRTATSRNLGVARGSAIYLSQEIHERSLFYFWPTNPIRAFCIRLASNPWYSGFNLIAIALNCIVLSMESGRSIPYGVYGFSSLDSALNTFELIFAIVFTFEFFVKCIAGGFILAGPTSYLRSNWNRLDFIVVILAILAFVPGFDNFTYLRSLRLFRPLKAASNVPGLRVMMSAMVESTMALGNVFLFVFLLLFTFGLLGLQFSKDSYHYRCFQTATGYQDPATVYGFASCSPGASGIWGFSPRTCPTGSFCADIGSNPYGGALGYDNIVMAWVMSFMVMSGEGWTDIMYMAEDAISPATLWYYLALTALANYLAGELVVAVMSVRFEDAKEKEKIKLREEREQALALKQASKAIQALQKKHRMSMHAGAFDPHILGKTSSIIQLANVIKERNRRQSSIRLPNKTFRSSLEKNPLSDNAISPMGKSFLPPQLNSHGSFITNGTGSQFPSQFMESEKSNAASSPDTEGSQGASKGGQSENSLSRQNSQSKLGSKNSDTNTEKMPTQLKILSTESTKAESWKTKLWLSYRILCHRLVFNLVSVRLGSLFTTINSLCLGMYYFGMDESFKNNLDTINLALTIAFGIEFILRFSSLGWSYFRHGYFVLDFIVIVVAIFELSFPDSSSLQALRAFRVFRMFTVFRDWQAMRSLMRQVHRSLEDLFYFSLVLALFIFLFAQIGVSIASGKLNFPPPQGLARDNMDNLGWAAIVVFQLSTPENWNQVYYDFHQGLGWGGAFYIFVTVLIGHYVIESLFVVVMLSNFGSDPDEENEFHAPRGSTFMPNNGFNNASFIAPDKESDSDAAAPAAPQNGLAAPAVLHHNLSTIADDPQQLDEEQPKNDSVTIQVNSNSRPISRPTSGRRVPNPGDPLTEQNPADDNLIRIPGGFLSGQSSVRVPKFVRRIGKNIAKSKARAKAEREKREENEVMALASRKNSTSNSPAISRTSTRAGKSIGGNPMDDLAVGTQSFSKKSTGGGLFDGALSALSSFKFPFGKSKTFSGTTDEMPTNKKTRTPPISNHGRSPSSATPPIQERDNEPPESIALTELKSPSPPTVQPQPAADPAMPLDHSDHDHDDHDAPIIPPVILSRASIAPTSPLLPPLQRSIILPNADLVPLSNTNFLTPRSLSPVNAFKPASGQLTSLLTHSPKSLNRSISPDLGGDSDNSRPGLFQQSSIDPAFLHAEHQPLARFDSNLQTFYVPAPEVMTPKTKPMPMPSDSLSPPAFDGGELLIDQQKMRRHVRAGSTVAVNMDPKSLLVIPHHHVTRNSLFHLTPPSAFDYTSCGIFHPENRFRNWLCDVIHDDYWNVGVFCLILFSCVLLALDYPDLDPNSTRAQALTVMEYITTVLYVFEMICRIIVFGFISHRDSYLRDRWNVMEFAIVIISLVSFGYPSLSFLKASRALRPLRILSRVPSARVIVSSLARSMSNMSNVMVVSFLLLYILALVGVQLFQGRLQQCLSVPSGAPIPVDITQCASRGGIWRNPLWTGNYDNIFSSLLVMFELSTEENWPGIMVTAVDATEYGKQPRIENNQVVGLYFVVCVILGSMFIKNLFTATILDGYSLNYAEITGAGGEATPHQELWLDFYKLIVDNKPIRSIPRPKVRWFSIWDLKFRRLIFDFCRTPYFEYVFLIVITINVLSLSMVYTDQDQTYTDVLFVINSSCTWAFVVEILILWLGMGVRAYFRNGWNTFDFIVVVASVFEFFVDANYIPFSLGFNPSFFRVVRMTRIFKIFRKFPRLVQLGNTVWFALPALYNVGLLMFLLFFVYSILAMNIFGNVKYGFYMTEHGNFETFTSAMVTLFRMVTGENWNGIMRDCMVEQPFCNGSNCGNSIVAPIVFISFMIFSSMLVMDLIVAIVLNQFENELAKEKRVLDAFVNVDDILEFGVLWSEFSGGELHLPISKLNHLIRALPGHNRLSPMQFETESVEIYALIDALEIPCDHARVHYLDVIYQLGQRAFYLRFPEQRDELDQRLIVAHATFTESHRLHLRRDAELFATSGIPLANEDLKLIREQALREFPMFKQTALWRNQAGYVNRIVLVQKLARGFLDRRNSPISKAKMQSMVKSLKKAVLRHSNADQQLAQYQRQIGEQESESNSENREPINAREPSMKSKRKPAY